MSVMPTVTDEAALDLYFELLDRMDSNGVIDFTNCLELTAEYAGAGRQGMDRLSEMMGELTAAEWVFPDPPNWIVCLPPRFRPEDLHSD